MDTKKKQGRPSVMKRIYGDSADDVARVFVQKCGDYTSRSKADMSYCMDAACILKEAASEIDNIDVLFRNDYVCRSILSQLGRMWRQDGFNKASVIEIAKEAIRAKIFGESVKEIEAYIRHGRMTDEW